MSSGIEDKEKQQRAAEKTVLALTRQYRVRYEHPGVFIAGPARVQIERERIGAFLARIARAMKADRPDAGTDPHSRFKEYDELARVVYVCGLRDDVKANLFEVFRFRAVNADDPAQQDRYRYPVTAPLPPSVQAAYEADTEQPQARAAEPGIEPS